MAKKSNKKSAARSRNKHVAVSSTHLSIRRSMVGYIIIVFVTFMSLSMSIYLVDRMVVSHNIQNRYQEFTKNFESLGLDGSYIIDINRISGSTKATNPLDDTKTYSSIVTFGHNASVSDTISDLSHHIEAAGYVPATSSFAGTEAENHYFKHPDGGLIAINAISKATRDMELYGTPTLEKWQKLDKNAGPSYVTIQIYQ